MFILIAVILIGLLTAAIVRSSNTSNETGDFEQAQILASQILRYASTVETVVSRLQTQGCSEQQYSFENPEVEGYENSLSPDDESCHIFSAAGGGLTFETPPQSASAFPWAIYGDHAVHGMGTTENPVTDRNADLILFLRDIPVALCNAINLQLGLDFSSPPNNGGTRISDDSEEKFQGSFVLDGEITGSTSSQHCPDDGRTPLCYVNSGCYEEENSSYFVFYHVLLSR